MDYTEKIVFYFLMLYFYSKRENMKNRLIITMLLVIVFVLSSACQDKKREILNIDFDRLKESSNSYDFYIEIDDKLDIVELYTQSKSQDTRGVETSKKISWTTPNGNDEVCFESGLEIKITLVDKKEKPILVNSRCVPKNLLKSENKIVFTNRDGDSVVVKLRGCDEV